MLKFIRKAVASTRKLFLVFAWFFIAMFVCSIDSIPCTFPAICLGISVICFGITVALNWLYWHLTWNINNTEV